MVLISYRHFKVSYIDMNLHVKNATIFQRTVPFKDVATKGIKQKYYWWSAYDLLRRLAFMLIILFEGLFTEYQQVQLLVYFNVQITT